MGMSKGLTIRLLFYGPLALVVLVACWFMFGVNGKRANGSLPPLTAGEARLAAELRGNVQELAGRIGERNVEHYGQLVAAADFIHSSLEASGYKPTRQSYELFDKNCDNIEAELTGTGPGILVLGAHYDSVLGSPGANDNGTGVAALLALARELAGEPFAKTVRFVAFVNEEPFQFQSPAMGSWVYAKRCKDRREQITGMISLETLGYYSQEKGSQTYPAPLLNLLYPSAGNFVAFVGDFSSSRLVRSAVAAFSRHGNFPCEGAVLPAGVPGVGWSDHWSFWQHGFPAIMVTDTAPFRYPYYHTAADTPDKIDYDSLARVVSALQATVAELAR